MVIEINGSIFFFRVSISLYFIFKVKHILNKNLSVLFSIYFLYLLCRMLLIFYRNMTKKTQ